MSEQTGLDRFTGDSVREKVYDSQHWLARKYWSEGLIQEEIAELTDVSKSKISTLMGKHKVGTRSPMESRLQDESKPHDNEDWLIKKYYEEGLVMKEIADEAGVSVGTISNRFDEFDLEAMGKHERRVSDDFHKLNDEERLRDLYLNKKSGMREIGNMFDASRNAVRNRLLEFGIEIRDTRKANIAANTPQDSPLRDEQWLETEYVDKQRSSPDIADQLNVTADKVTTWMKRHGIERLDISKAVIISKSGEASEYLTDPDWLQMEYSEKGRSSGQIAEQLGVVSTTVLDALERHGIERRDPGESLMIRDMESWEGDEYQKLKDEEWMRTQYLAHERPPNEIAKQLGVATNTVCRQLDRFGIPKRGGYEYIERLGHKVRSEWELAVADVLVDMGIEYKYESLTIQLPNDKKYTPDFVTNNFVIEVKGQLLNDDERYKARQTMKIIDDKEYIVVGTKLPSDYHIPFENRDQLRDISL